jgi:dienelactone hydrolase
MCAGMATVMEWVGRHPVGSESTMAALAAVISELRLVHGVTKVTTEGFCWGAVCMRTCAAIDTAHCR